MRIRPCRAVAPLTLVVLLAACAGGAPEPAIAGAPEPATVAVHAPAAPAEAGGSFRAERFRSEALGVDKRYVIYLPPGYDATSRRYPVVYMLHGLGGSEDDWRNLGIGDAAAAVALEALIVMPDGDDGFYVNWASEVDHDACLRGARPFGREADMRTYCVVHARYEDYVVRDLVSHIDARYRTIARREARAIGGLSMGGYGALYLAMKHPDEFGAVASHAGVASLLYRGPRPYQRGQVQLSDDPRPWLAEAGALGALFRRIWGEDIATWRAHDPATLARELDDGRLAIYFDCGDQDELRLHDPNQYLHEVLSEAGVTHTFELVAGGRHDPAYWRSRIHDSLRFVSAYFARHAVAPPAPGPQ